MATQNIYSVTPDNRVVRTASDYESNPYLTRLSESDRSVVRGGLDYAQSQLIAEGERTLGQLSSMRAEDYAATALGEARASAYETAYDVKNRAAATGAVGVDNVLEQINKNLAQQESEIISGAQKDIATMRSDYQKGLIDTLNTYGEAQQKQEAAYVKAVDDLINYFFAYGGKVLDSTERGWGEEVLEDDALIEQYAKDAGYLDEYGNFTSDFMTEFGEFYYGDTMAPVSEALKTRNYDLYSALEQYRGQIAESIGLYETTALGEQRDYTYDPNELFGSYTQEEVAANKNTVAWNNSTGQASNSGTTNWSWRGEDAKALTQFSNGVSINANGEGEVIEAQVGAIAPGAPRGVYLTNVPDTITDSNGNTYTIPVTATRNYTYSTTETSKQIVQKGSRLEIVETPKTTTRNSVASMVTFYNMEGWNASNGTETKSLQSLIDDGKVAPGYIFTGEDGNKYMITHLDIDSSGRHDIRGVKLEKVA